MILSHFFEKPVLAQRFLRYARENVVPAHARGNAQSRTMHFFPEINVNDDIWHQNKFCGDWK